MMTTLVYILIAMILILTSMVIFLYIKINRFTRGGDGKSLEKTIKQLFTFVEEVHDDHKELTKDLQELEKRQRTSIRNIETIRFNPFKDQGSNQSFTTALINDEKNGLILSSLFARDRTSVFAKPIKNGLCEFELTDEEKEVLKKSLH